MAARLKGEEPDSNVFDPLPTFWSDQFGIRLQSVGNPALADQAGLIEGALSNLGKPGHGLAMGYWKDGAMIGVISIGLPAAKLSEYRAMLG